MPEAIWSNFPVIELHGPLDFSRLGYLDAMFESIKHLPRVTLDLRDVDFMDAATISCFVRLHNTIHPLRDFPASTGFEPSIRLVNVRPNIVRLLALVQLDGLFELHRIELIMQRRDALRFPNAALPASL
jgi:anti-anti-sigma regulatory factor